MRTFSTAVQTVINSDNIKFFYQNRLQFSVDYYFTSYPSDIVYDGHTYLADGGLFEFDSPKYSTVVDRESYKIVIADLDGAMAAEFRTNVIGRPIDVKVALLDSNGLPLTSTTDVLSIYKGFVDKPALDIDFDKKIAIIEGTSPMSDLDMVRSFQTTKSGMDQKSSTDTSFDEVFDDKEISMKWGKV